MGQRRIHILTICAVIGLVAAACGSDNGGSATATTDEAASASTPTAAVDDTTSTTGDTTSTTATDGSGDDADIEPTDYLTFAQGAVPISVELEGPGEDATISGSLDLIDGNTTGRSIVSAGTAETVVTYVYELPAETTFDRFAVPGILEVPSPSQTFFAEIQVSGSNESADAGFEVLTSASFEVHERAGEITELPAPEEIPVRWVKIQLSGGLDIINESASLDFSELIANGTQESVAFVNAFTGIWETHLPEAPERATGLLELTQDGVTVAGCFGEVDITGTVTGNLANLRGVDRSDGVISLYLLNVAPDGTIRGVANNNGGPFAFFPGNVAPGDATTDCSEVPEPENPLGCDSVVQGITFEFDSADLRPDSEPVLAQLYNGLVADDAASITVEGHTSTDGDEAYNQDLSERRAQSVVDDLVGRGIDQSRIGAVGLGETDLLVDPETDETARSLNRRVEIACT